MNRLIGKAAGWAFGFGLAVLASSPAAFAQAFLEPVTSQTAQSYDWQNFDSQGVQIASLERDIVNDPRFQQQSPTRYLPTEAQLNALTLTSLSSSNGLPGAPFTDGTRAQVEQVAIGWINASLDSRVDPRSQQVLNRDRKLDSLILKNSARLGANCAALEAQEQLIRAQDMALVNAHGGQDITSAEQFELNLEESALAEQIRRLSTP